MSLRCLDQDEYVHHGHTSSRHLQEVLQKRLQTSKHFLVSKTSWRGLKDVFSVTIFHLPGRLQDVRKTRNCYAESILKKYFSELVILRSSSGLLGDNKMLPGKESISVSNKFKSVSDKPTSDKSTTDPREIQDALIRTRKFRYSSPFETQITISGSCLAL